MIANAIWAPHLCIPTIAVGMKQCRTVTEYRYSNIISCFTLLFCFWTSFLPYFGIRYLSSYFSYVFFNKSFSLFLIFKIYHHWPVKLSCPLFLQPSYFCNLESVDSLTDAVSCVICYSTGTCVENYISLCSIDFNWKTNKKLQPCLWKMRSYPFILDSHFVLIFWYMRKYKISVFFFFAPLFLPLIFMLSDS